jgi:hypothetical protein
MNMEAPLSVAISVKKRETKEMLKKSPETGKPKSYREAMEEFSQKHKDFSKCEGNVSAVLPQGSPVPPKEGPELDEEELDEE